jgi:hypothetical protein
MNIKVNVKPQAIKALTIAHKKAAMMTAEQMRHEIITDAVIPFDTGNLQNVVTYVDNSEIAKGEIKIVHDAPYARRLYYHPEYNFQKTFNVNARGEWWSEWLEGKKKKRPVKLFKEFYRRLTGGYVK